MKISHWALVALLVACLTSPVLGQAEMITLYADAAGTDCSLTDAAPGLVTVHMVHVSSTIRSGSQFSAPKPDCWTQAIYLGETFTHPLTAIVGNTQTDLAVFYLAGGPCLEPPVHIGTMTFWGTGAAQPCCEYPVLPAPSSRIPGSVISFECTGGVPNFYAIGAGKVTINETEDCLCNPPLAVEETTWGRVKALYH